MSKTFAEYSSFHLSDIRNKIYHPFRIRLPQAVFEAPPVLAKPVNFFYKSPEGAGLFHRSRQIVDTAMLQQTAFIFRQAGQRLALIDRQRQDAQVFLVRQFAGTLLPPDFCRAAAVGFSSCSQLFLVRFRR